MRLPSLRLMLPAIVLTFGLAIFGSVILATRAPVSAPPLVGGPFQLIAQDGTPRSDRDFLGAPMLVFFGYTHCPDVCPTTLNDLSLTLGKLGAQAKINVVFITVDPERDTPAVLKNYLASFDARITGLSGTPAALAPVYKSYRLYVKKIPDGKGDYAMDHTALVYLMDKNGAFISSFNTNLSPQDAAKELAGYL